MEYWWKSAHPYIGAFIILAGTAILNMSGRISTLNSKRRSKKIKLLQSAAVASAAKKARLSADVIPTTPAKISEVLRFVWCFDQYIMLYMKLEYNLSCLKVAE